MNAMLFSPKTGMFNPGMPAPGQGQKIPGRPDFDITHPSKWPQWLKNCHTENASVEVLPPTEKHPQGYVLWWGGAFHDGIWMDGDFLGGRWRDGIWLGGHFREGIWHTGEFRGGIFHNWVWLDGVFRGGIFRGTWLGGIWRPSPSAVFEGFCRRSNIPPKIKTLVEEWDE